MTAHVLREYSVLDVRSEFGAHEMSELSRSGDVWTARSGPVHLRWSGAGRASERQGSLSFDLELGAGEHHDLVLELSRRPLPDDVPDPGISWEETEHVWVTSVPPVENSIATAIRADLASDYYLYRFAHDERPLAEAEGAFLMCGFQMSLALHQIGEEAESLRWFERNRAACGSPALFSEEFDVGQRQLRGNLPQAFVHGLMFESARRLAEPWPEDGKG
jgi:hypothetical protein